jgi:uncharacterized protein involved in exopolysaccharide biosynthesis
VEASGPAVVPAYEPSSPPELERRPSSRPEPSGGRAERLALLWSQRRFLWGVAWKTFLAAVVVAYSLPLHYESTAKIVPGDSQSGAMGLLGKLGGAAASAGALGLDPTSMLGMKTPGAFFIEVMKSRTVQDRMIDTFKLQQHYTIIGRNLPSVYNSRFGQRWLVPSYYTTRKQLKSFTDFEEDRKSGVITITVTDYDKNIAAAMANAYVSELNRLAAQLNTSEAHRERVFLEERLKTVKQDLDEASLALSEFSSKNKIMDPQSQGRTMQDAAARIQGELIANETELRGLQQIYSDDNVRVRTLKARIGELQSQMHRIVGGTGTPAGESAESGSNPPSLRALPMLGYQYSDLYRKAKIQETLYEFLTQQYEMAKVQEAKELPTARTMDVAIPPERKSGPIRTLVVGLSVLGGLVLGCFWVIWKNSWDRLPADDSRRMLAAQVRYDLRAALRRGKSRGQTEVRK